MLFLSCLPTPPSPSHPLLLIPSPASQTHHLPPPLLPGVIPSPLPPISSSSSSGTVEKASQERCHVFSASINDIYQLETTRQSQSHATRWLGADHQCARHRPPASPGPRAQTQAALGLAGGWVRAAAWAGRDGGEGKVLLSSTPAEEGVYFGGGKSSFQELGTPSRGFAPVTASLPSRRGLCWKGANPLLNELKKSGRGIWQWERGLLPVGNSRRGWQVSHSVGLGGRSCDLRSC